MEFEWDENKAAKNSRKHSVSFLEGSTVFGDPLAVTFPDPDHSADEDRFITIGMSNAGRVPIVSHTNRGDRIRIISVPVANRRESKTYKEES